MATVGPTEYLDCTMGGQFRLGPGSDLAASTALATGNIYRARLKTGGNISALAIRVKCTATSTGGFTVQLVPQTANIQPDSLTVSDVATSLSTGTVLTSATEGIHSYTMKGEQVVDITVDCSVSSAGGTVTYVDVFAVEV